MAARHREGDGSKRPGGRESAVRAHRGISPPEASQHRGGPAAHPGRRTGAPLTGLAPTATYTPRATAGQGERSPAAYRRPPWPSHAQSCCARLPAPLPFSGLLGHCSARGRHRRTEAQGRHPREARPARSQTGERWRSHARDEEEGRQRRGGADKHAQRGPSGDQKTPGHGLAARKTSAGSQRHSHKRAVLRRLGRRLVQAIPRAGPTTRPRRHGWRAIHPSFLRPSSTDPSFHLVSSRGSTSWGHALERGDPAGSAHRLRLEAPQGCGTAEPDLSSPPWAHHWACRANEWPHLPGAWRAQQDPPPTDGRGMGPSLFFSASPQIQSLRFNLVSGYKGHIPLQC